LARVLWCFWVALIVKGLLFLCWNALHIYLCLIALYTTQLWHVLGPWYNDRVVDLRFLVRGIVHQPYMLVLCLLLLLRSFCSFCFLSFLFRRRWLLNYINWELFLRMYRFCFLDRSDYVTLIVRGKVYGYAGYCPELDYGLAFLFLVRRHFNFTLKMFRLLLLRLRQRLWLWALCHACFLYDLHLLCNHLDLNILVL